MGLDETQALASHEAATPEPLTLRERLFVALQHWLPQHLLSRWMQQLAASRVRPVKNFLIGIFVRRYRPDLSVCTQPDPQRYPSFNAFFTRALHPGARPVDLHPQALVSPVDGTVSQIGVIMGSTLVQAKGHCYSLEALLDSPAWAQRFAGGSYATLYLAPRDYHRVHMPLAGTLRAAWYVPGALFSVNTTTASSVPGLFTRNERVACVFEDPPAAFALVLIGALLVGSIATLWHGEITPRAPRRRCELLPAASGFPLHLAKGDEMGRFNMGSTVILLLPPGLATWLPALAPGSPVRMGQMLARLAPTSERAP
jgi:phosphatidylserine decarboxylase